MKSQNRPKLYQYAVCPFCCKVKAILHYKKISYETVEVHPLNKKEIKFSSGYKKVPIFISASGQQVNDSTPIMRFIDQHYAENPVFEVNGEAKALEDQWVDWSDKVLVRALPPLIYQSLSDATKAFDYITREGKFSWFQQRTIKYSGALVMKLIAKKSAKEQGITDPKKHLIDCLAKWGKALGKQKLLGVEKPNGADLAIYGVLNSIEELPGFEIVRANPQVIDWYDRVAELTLAKKKVAA